MDELILKKLMLDLSDLVNEYNNDLKEGILAGILQKSKTLIEKASSESN